MVAANVKVYSRAYGADEAYVWESNGAEGYTVEPCEKASNGTQIVLTIKEDTEDEKYSEFLESYRVQELVRKYSDYIRYPIRMEVEKSRESSRKGRKRTRRRPRNMRPTRRWKPSTAWCRFGAKIKMS